MRITHPRPEMGIIRYLGVEFRDGVAEVDELHPERRLALLQHGFTVDDTEDLKALTVPELKDLAVEKGVEVPSKVTKSELVEKLADAENPDIEVPPVGD